MTDENESSKTFFVGPAQNSWYKYKLAQIIMKILLFIPYGTKIPIVGQTLFKWSLENTLGAREVIEQ